MDNQLPRLGYRGRYPAHFLTVILVLQPIIETLSPNDFVDWSDFENHQSADPFDDYGWFHVRVGAGDVAGTNDFQVCVSTAKACGRAKAEGSIAGIIVDRFDASTVRNAITLRVTSIRTFHWDDLINELRKFMHWEYEGMSGT